MLFKFIFILSGLQTCTVYAEELGNAPPLEAAEISIDRSSKKRTSSASASFLGDGEDYRSGTLGLKLGLDESWQLQLSGSTSESEGAIGTRSLTVKADDSVSDFFSFNFGLKRQNEPNSVTASGGNLDLDFTISELWQSELDSRITVSGGLLFYKLPVSGKFGRTREISTPQTVLTVAYSQDIIKTINLDFSVSKYIYSIDQKQLSRFVNNRVAQLPGVLGVVSGFPDSSANLDMTWQFIDSFTFEASVSRSKASIDASVTKSLGLGLDWASKNHWGIGIDAISSTTDDSSVPSKSFGLNLAYRW